MRNPVRLTILIAVMVFARAQAPSVSWEESLSQQYKTGTLLNVVAAGLSTTSGCNVHPTSSFKDGKLHAPGFGQAVLLGAAQCGPLEPIAPGTQMYLSVLQVTQKSNRIDLVVSQGTIASQVTFEFPKGFLATANLAQIQKAIGQVFSVVHTPDIPAATATSQVALAATQQALLSSPPIVVPGSLYVSSQNGTDRLQLSADNSFSLQEGGQSFTGTYLAGGTTLKLHIAELQKDVDIVAQENALVVNGTEIWTLAVGPLYVNSANSADKIQLTSAGTFTLEEGGQAFTGSYAVAGAKLKLHISELQKDIDIAIQGNRLLVNGNESWVSPESVSAKISSPDGLDKDKANSVLNRAIQFLGGSENIRALRDLDFRLQGTVSSPRGAINVQVHEIIVYPSIVRVEVKQSRGKQAQENFVFFDGTNGWRKMGGGRPTEATGAEKRESREDAFNQLPNLLGLVYSPAVRYQGKSGENDVLSFELGDLSARLHVDASGQVVRLAYRSASGDVEETYGDYREVGGVKVAHTISSTRNGQKYIDAQITEVKPNTNPSLEGLAQKPK